MIFGDPTEELLAVAELFEPSNTLTPIEAAVEHGLHDKDGKAFDPDITPYMLEPVNQAASRLYRQMVFVGPARTGKSLPIVMATANWIATCAPGDTAIFSSSQDKARELSEFEFDPIVRNSPGLQARMSTIPSDDNVHDKKTRSGIVFRFGWPSVSQLSASTLRYVVMTDYDRAKGVENIGGQGSFFDQGSKRTETYMSRGKVFVESSPGFDQSDPSWVASTPHEAPPAGGIASLYNRGTRARWYWGCRECGERFQVFPDPFVMFDLPEFADLEQKVTTADLMGLAQEYAMVACKRCGAVHRMPDRPTLNLGGRWLHDGERFDRHGEIVGQRIVSLTASYWLGGAAAAFQPWEGLLFGLFTAIREYAQTGREDAIRARIQVDSGWLYMPRAAATRRKAEDLVQRAEKEFWPRGTVPAAACFLTTAVDVQANRFIVQVFAWGPNLEGWLVDRFHLSQSLRLDGDRPALFDPAGHVEDWDVLIDEVIGKRYPLEEDASLSMASLLTVCDSGGKEGVTQRAYEFVRRLRASNGDGRFRLVKGANSADAKAWEETWPNSKNEKDRVLGARGDVPVIRINTTIYKDALLGSVGSDMPGPGYIHYARWTDRKLFNELVAEDRGSTHWHKRGRARNEAIDLAVYARVACAVLRAETIDWRRPPEWARRPMRPAAGESIEQPKTRAERMAALAKSLNGG